MCKAIKEVRPSVRSGRIYELFAVPVCEISGQVRLKLTIVGVDGGTEGGLGRIALADALEDALNVAHAVGVIDIGHSSQGLGIGHIGFSAGESIKASLQRIERDIPLSFEELGELAAFATETPGLDELGNPFVKPGRAAAAGQLGNKGVREFMLQDVGEFRRHGAQSADRDTQLAVIQPPRPAGGASDIEEGLFGVEGDNDIVARRIAKVANQVVVVGFKRRQDLGAKRL